MDHLDDFLCIQESKGGLMCISVSQKTNLVHLLCMPAALSIGRVKTEPTNEENVHCKGGTSSPSVLCCSIMWQIQFLCANMGMLGHPPCLHVTGPRCLHVNGVLQTLLSYMHHMLCVIFQGIPLCLPYADYHWDCLISFISIHSQRCSLLSLYYYIMILLIFCMIQSNTSTTITGRFILRFAQLYLLLLIL